MYKRFVQSQGVSVQGVSESTGNFYVLRGRYLVGKKTDGVHTSNDVLTSAATIKMGSELIKAAESLIQL
jgi:hypothetical protein